MTDTDVATGSPEWLLRPGRKAAAAVIFISAVCLTLGAAGAVGGWEKYANGGELGLAVRFSFAIKVARLAASSIDAVRPKAVP